MSNPENNSGEEVKDHADEAKKGRSKTNQGRRQSIHQSQGPKISGINTGAGVAGVGGGTLLAALAKNLPDSNEWKSWMLILAPSASVLLAALWTWCNNKIDAYIQQRNTEGAIKAARAEFDKVLENTHLSQEVRASVIKEREDFEQTVVSLRVSKFKLYVSKKP